MNCANVMRGPCGANIREEDEKKTIFGIEARDNNYLSSVAPCVATSVIASWYLICTHDLLDDGFQGKDL